MKVSQTGLLQLFKVEDKSGEFRKFERRTANFRNNFQGCGIQVKKN
jgi:hypothetical protein